MSSAADTYSERVALFDVADDAAFAALLVEGLRRAGVEQSYLCEHFDAGRPTVARWCDGSARPESYLRRLVLAHLASLSPAGI